LKLFAGFGGQLPLPTRILLAVSAGCQQGWVWGLILLAVAACVGVWRWQGERLRVLIDQVTLRLPLVSGLVRKLELARFARSFGMLLEHGVPIIQATEVAVPVVRHRIIRHELARALATLKEGNALADCLKGLSIATPLVVQTVAVGEEGGKVDAALAEIANLYERDVEQLLQMLAALLEPVMILGVGAIVGFIVMAVLLPIFELNVIAR
jgi:type II secretory pathway component PulF